MTLEEIFAMKTTENGDNAYKTTRNPMLDILFMSEYYGKHLDEIPYIGTSMTAKLFAMMMRDPRFGLGRRELGRRLMLLAEVTPSDVVKAGRFDDLVGNKWMIFHLQKCVSSCIMKLSQEMNFVRSGCQDIHLRILCLLVRLQSSFI